MWGEVLERARKRSASRVIFPVTDFWELFKYVWVFWGQLLVGGFKPTYKCWIRVGRALRGRMYRDPLSTLEAQLSPWSVATQAAVDSLRHL